MQTETNNLPISLNLSLKDKAALYTSFMPFIKGGGLFISTHTLYELGTEIIVSLSLMDELVATTLTTKVIWITPKGSPGGRKAGVGVQIIDDNNSNIIKKIENYLAGSDKSERPTDTL